MGAINFEDGRKSFGIIGGILPRRGGLLILDLRRSDEEWKAHRLKLRVMDRGYRAHFFAKELKGYKNVKVFLFRSHWCKEKEPRYNWSELVDGYDEVDRTMRDLSRKCILENFTIEEIQLLKKWFQDHENADLEIYLEDFPIAPGLLPIGAIGASGVQEGYIMFSETKNWDLPVEVSGYYNAKDCDKVEDK